MPLRKSLVSLLVLLLALPGTAVYARTFKIATLAPAGTAWMKEMRDSYSSAFAEVGLALTPSAAGGAAWPTRPQVPRKSIMATTFSRQATALYKKPRW